MRHRGLLALVGTLLMIPIVQADNEVDDAAKVEPVARRVINRTIDEIQLSEQSSSTPMTAHVVLRWPNPVRGSRDGATVIWTSSGIPKAVCCLYVWNDRDEIGLAFGSLSDRPLSAVWNGRARWTPNSTAIQWRELPDAGSVGETPARRALQMKSLARRFTASLENQVEGRYELRRLSRPVYSYARPSDGRMQTDGILDGTVFAFCQATDPEAILLIEARASDDQPKWHYATHVRTGAGQVRIQLDGSEVDRLTIGSNSMSNHYHEFGERFTP